MKKIISSVIVASMALSMAACSKQETQSTPNNMVETELSQEQQDSTLILDPSTPEEPVSSNTNSDNSSALEFVTFEAAPQLSASAETIDVYDGSQRIVYTTGLGSVQEVDDKLSAFRFGDKYTELGVAYTTDDRRIPANKGEESMYGAELTFISNDKSGPTYDFVKFIIRCDYHNFNDVNSIQMQIYNSDHVTEEQYKFAVAAAEHLLGDVGKYMLVGYDIDDGSKNISDKIEIDDKVKYFISRRGEVGETECVAGLYFESMANEYTTTARTCRNLLQFNSHLKDVFSNIVIPEDDALMNENLHEVLNCIPGAQSAHIASINKRKATDYETCSVNIDVILDNGEKLTVFLSYRDGDSSSSRAIPFVSVGLQCLETNLTREEVIDIYLDIVQVVKPDMEITYRGTHKKKEDYHIYDVKSTVLGAEYVGEIQVRPYMDGWQIM